MSDKEKLNDIPGQLGGIQKTRHIIDVLLSHPAFSSADAAELLLGLDRLEAETVLTAPPVQDAREVVSSMLEKGFIPKEPADSFFTILKDPRTADLLKRDILPVPNPDPQVTKRDIPPVIDSAPPVPKTRISISRRKLLVGGALVLGGLVLEYFQCPEPYRTISRSSFAQDELPPGWYRAENYGAADSVLFRMQKSGEEVQSRDATNIAFFAHPSSEIAKRHFIESSNINPSDLRIRSVSGVGDMASLYSHTQFDYHNKSLLIVVDKMLIRVTVDPKHDNEQTVLNLGNSAVNYLTRIGVTPSIK